MAFCSGLSEMLGFPRGSYLPRLLSLLSESRSAWGEIGARGRSAGPEGGQTSLMAACQEGASPTPGGKGCARGHLR